MSDTPESDKNSVEWDRANEAGCSYKFACHLERDRDELRERVAELKSALNRFDFDDVTLSEGDEMDICVTFEDQQILRAALKTKENK